MASSCAGFAYACRKATATAWYPPAAISAATRRAPASSNGVATLPSNSERSTTSKVSRRFNRASGLR